MQMFIWDKYNSTEITENIKYWVDMWEDLIDHFTERLYGLSLENPRLLLRDIIDEIEFNGFKNSENKKYFQKMADEVLQKDIVVQIIFKPEWTLLRREFGFQRWAYLRQLCKGLLRKFEDGTYFHETLSSLKNVLLSDKDDKQLMRLISQNLIVEFLHKEYSLKTIKEFAANIFDKYYIREDGHLITKYPFSSDWKSFMEGDIFNEESFNRAISAELDSVTIPERLDKLKYYFLKKPKDNYIIFEVEGIKGDVDINIGDVNFYSIAVKRYLKIESKRDDESFNKKDGDMKFINAAVRIPMVDFDGSKRHATEKINKALDILRAYYSPKTPFEILPSYLIVDDQGKETGMSFGRKKGESGSRWWESLNLADAEIDKAFFDSICDFLFKATGSQNEIERKLTRSLRWFRKGEETENSEDKIVSYWIVLENILSFKEPLLPKCEKIHALAMEIMPAIEGLRMIYYRGWQLFDYILNMTHSFHGARQLLDLPKAILDKCNLALIGETIYLKPFIDNLGELQKFVERAIVKEKIEDTIKFYGDIAFAKITIEEFKTEIQEDILLIYRFRNKIVHNAHYDNAILPFYAEKIRRYAGDLLRTIINKYSNNKMITIEEIILEQYVEMNNMIEKLSKNVKVDFFTINKP